MGARRDWPHIKHLRPGRSHPCLLSCDNLAPTPSTFPTDLSCCPWALTPSVPATQPPSLPQTHQTGVTPGPLHRPFPELSTRLPPSSPTCCCLYITLPDWGEQEGLDPQPHPPSLSWPPPPLGVSLPGTYHHLTCDIFLSFISLSVCIPPLESKLYEGRDFPSTLTRHSWNE